MAEFHCNECKQMCCTCSGCQPAFTRGGKQCCTRCIVGVQRREDYEQQTQLLQSVQQPRKENKPNELLYVNGVR